MSESSLISTIGTLAKKKPSLDFLANIPTKQSYMSPDHYLFFKVFAFVIAIYLIHNIVFVSDVHHSNLTVVHILNAHHGK